MKSLANYLHNVSHIIYEGLDIDNLYWKVKLWYESSTREKISFWKMMQDAKNDPPKTEDELNIILDRYGVSWRNFCNFAMNNVKGTEDYNQLYMMKKIVDTLLANKSISWELN